MEVEFYVLDFLWPITLGALIHLAFIAYFWLKRDVLKFLSQRVTPSVNFVSIILLVGTTIMGLQLASDVHDIVFGLRGVSEVNTEPVCDVFDHINSQEGMSIFLNGDRYAVFTLAFPFSKFVNRVHDNSHRKKYVYIEHYRHNIIYAYISESPDICDVGHEKFQNFLKSNT